MKKFFSILAALVLCFAFSTFALAEADITVVETTSTITETSAEPETTIAETVAETTAIDETSTQAETSEDPAETTSPDQLTDTTAVEEDTTMDPVIYYNEALDDVKRDVLIVPQTGSASGGIAVFAVLSIAAAGAFVCVKKKA